ncbi:hypothetical protein BCEP4_2070011 [Burkholderia cepacia]|nr:hypothetical protein BCEP4_2070011 [Burkholderia cepacia]
MTTAGMIGHLLDDRSNPRLSSVLVNAATSVAHASKARKCHLALWGW